MRNVFRPALASLLLLTLLTGVAYPLLITGVSALAFPKQARGSLLVADGKQIGSDLIGQPFDDPKYFWSRPSATTGVPYNAAASGGSNLAPANPQTLDAVAKRVAALRAADPGNANPVPVDLVTASASGLDPHVSVAAARYQVARVARLRGLNPDALLALIDAHAERRTFGVLGEPRVNVLRLNLALAATSSPSGSQMVTH
jgi:potassium-transporting ATPase KdpC subunit